MAFLTSLQNSIKKIDKNYLLVFLIILIGFVIVDCNTKMFSKMLEGNANINSGGSCGGAVAKPNDPIKNPTNTAKNSANVAKVNALNSKNSNGPTKQGLPQGIVEGEHLYVSATGPLGRKIPKTLEQDYSVLKSFGLTNLKDVENYIPSGDPAQFKDPASPKIPSFANANANANRNANRNANANAHANRNANANANANANRNANANKNANANRNANANANSKANNNSGKWQIYGRKTCGWTKKQMEHIKNNNIDHDYFECPDGCPDWVKGFPSHVSPEGKQGSGFIQM